MAWKGDPTGEEGGSERSLGLAFSSREPPVRKQRRSVAAEEDTAATGGPWPSAPLARTEAIMLKSCAQARRSGGISGVRPLSASGEARRILWRRSARHSSSRGRADLGRADLIWEAWGEPSKGFLDREAGACRTRGAEDDGPAPRRNQHENGRRRAPGEARGERGEARLFSRRPWIAGRGPSGRRSECSRRTLERGKSESMD